MNQAAPFTYNLTPMAIPANKAELLNAITTQYDKLKKELISLPVGLTALEELEAHAKDTLMSIHDLLAYIVGWGTLVLKWHSKKSLGEAVDFPETGYKWNELGRLAQKFYKDYKEEAFTALLLQSDQVKDKIIFLIQQSTEQELYGQSWYEKWSLGRMIQFNTASPYTNARGRIRKWKKTRQLK